jgi:sensor domain CHASE-containing protein
VKQRGYLQVGAGLSALVGVAVAVAAARRSLLLRKETFDHQVTGVAVTKDGRRFVNFPRWTDDAPISVAELLPDGSLRPYPNETWNAWRNDRAARRRTFRLRAIDRARRQR